MKQWFVRLASLVHSFFLFLISTICILVSLTSGNYHGNDLFAYLSIFFMGLAGYLMFINGLFTGRHFDKIFKDKLLANESLNELFYTPALTGKCLIYSRSMRANLYAFCIVFPGWAKKIYYYKNTFNNYSFREKARRVDIVFSYAFSLSGLLFIMFMFLGLTWSIMGWLLST